MQTFSRRFFRLAVPNIISNVTVPLVGLADTIMLGHLPQVRFLAGVALASVIFDYVYWTFGFLRMGTTGTTAQALGRREIAEVYRLLYRSLVVALALGTGVLVLQQPIRKLSFALLSGAPDVEAAGREYFNARIWGAPAALCNFVFIGWYLGREESQNALYMTLIANLSNIALNYIFLYKMHLQAFGAGLGSMISQYLMLGLGLWIFYRRKHRICWRWQEILNWPRISAMLQLNFDILVRTLCLISAFALFTNFSAVLGTGLLVANSILLRILGFAAYFIDGAAFATESLAGIFHGEQNRPALQHLLRYALLWGEIFAFGFIGILLIFPGAIYAAMTSHANIVALIREYDHWLMFSLAFGALAYIYDGFFLGLTRGRALRNAMAVSFFLGFLPPALLGLWLKNNHWLWGSMLLFMMMRAATLARANRVLAQREG